MTRIRILIADGHHVMRRSIRAVLEYQLSWFVVGEAKTGPEALAKTVGLEPDVVVLDIALPLLSGLEVTREIARVSPRVHVVVLTLHASADLARRVHEAGARGYVPKPHVAERLPGLIQGLIDRTTLSGHRREPAVIETANDENRRRASQENGLTIRERQVLHLLAEGNTNKQVSSALGISVKTVETHRARLMGKLHLHSVGQLVRFAIRHRIISP
jgi:two-component system, NarL family, response regulator NreC